ncbi:MAG: M48 family metalloprotease [Planctomycetota bacterium]|jgi:predicted Zn-dependent protease
MFVSHTLIAALILSLAETCFPARPLPAAEPPAGVADEVFPHPQKILDRLFGPPREEDKRALAKIEVSAAEERQMGEAAVGAYLADLKRRKIRVVTRGRDVEYLRKLVERIRRLMKNGKRYPRIRVYLAQSSRCDARSFPGGTLVFFRGLLDSAGSEAAVVGIVGHELAHLDRGHHLQRLRRIKLAERTFAEGPKASSFERFFAAGSMMLQIWTQPFRPEDEAEADRDGARWACAAGYDPREMARLFLDLGKRRNNWGALLPAFLRTHPAPEGRHQAIMELYKKLQQEKPNQRLYIGKENLRRRVTRTRQEFKE